MKKCILAALIGSFVIVSPALASDKPTCWQRLKHRCTHYWVCAYRGAQIKVYQKYIRQCEAEHQETIKSCINSGHIECTTGVDLIATSQARAYNQNMSTNYCDYDQQRKYETEYMVQAGKVVDKVIAWGHGHPSTFCIGDQKPRLFVRVRKTILASLYDYVAGRIRN